jgi:hypothetical protein
LDDAALALSCIAEFLVTADERTGQEELVTAGVRAINRDVVARLRQERNDCRKPADRTFMTYLWAARKEFLRLWHEGQRPSRIWGHDFFGIEGESRTENITVRTLRQRKRKKRRQINGHSRNT